MIDIIMPTLKTCGDMEEVIRIIEATTLFDHRLIVTGQEVSASKNRNYGLEAVTSEIIIMVDDDIRGYYRGWNADLLEPLKYKDVIMVSARLMRVDGGLAPNCAGNFDDSQDFIYIERGRDNCLPSAAIAFRNVGARFDENFKGSGWEDTDFCWQLAEKRPDAKFVINNRCKLTHLLEQKNQFGKNNEIDNHNKEYFYKKWNIQR